MPVGVPDFWPGQLIHYENVPTDGRLDASPTSNWAYDHAQLAQHAGFETSWADVLALSRPVYTRMINVDSYHMVLADWVKDGAWHDWLVPFGGQISLEGVVIRVQGVSIMASASLELKGAGPVGAVNIAAFLAGAAGVVRNQDFIIGLDETGVVRYRTYADMWSVLSALMTGFFR